MDFGIKLKELRTEKNLTQLQMAEILDTSKSNISKYESGSVEPNLEMLVKISRYFDVPTDYLLESGVFENWNFLLENKEKVLEVIASCTSRISKDLKNGTDDITFAKLVYAFNIQIQRNENDIGITAKDPIPTYPNSIKSRYTPKKNDSDADILHYYNQLTAIDKVWIMGQIADLIKGYSQPKESSIKSVAADEQLKEVK